MAHKKLLVSRYHVCTELYSQQRPAWSNGLAGASHRGTASSSRTAFLPHAQPSVGHCSVTAKCQCCHTLAVSGVPQSSFQEERVTADLLPHGNRYSPMLMRCSPTPDLNWRDGAMCIHCMSANSAFGCARATAHMYRAEDNLRYQSSPSTLNQDLCVVC